MATIHKYIARVKKLLMSPKQGEIWCLYRVIPNRSIYPSNRELQISPNYLEKLIGQYQLTTGMPDGTACLWWEQLESLVNSPKEFEITLKSI